MSKEIKITPRTSDELKAQLEELEKEDVKQRAKINSQKKKIREELSHRHSVERAERMTEFIKDKTPFWLGIKSSWTAHKLILVLNEPQMDSTGSTVNACVNTLGIECRLHDKVEQTMDGLVDGNFSMSFARIDIGSLSNKTEWKNISELEFKARVKELSGPFFDEINRVTKPIFKLSSNNLLE